MRKTTTIKPLLLAGALSILCAGTSKAQLALDLAGSGNYVETTYSLASDSPFTVEFDMYMHSLINFNAGITATCGNNANPIDFYFDASGNANFSDGYCSASFSASSSGYSAGTWYHIAIVHGATFQYYVNGVLAGFSG
jgi:hypothetical protein